MGSHCILLISNSAHANGPSGLNNCPEQCWMQHYVNSRNALNCSAGLRKKIYRVAMQLSGRYRLFKTLPSFLQLTKVEAEDGGPDPPAHSLGYGEGIGTCGAIKTSERAND